MSKMKLKFGEIQKFAFVETYVDIPIQLVDDNDNTINERVVVEPKCLFDSLIENVAPESLCVFENCVIDKNGNGKLRTLFRDAICNHHSKRAIISISAGSNQSNIVGAKSSPISIIRYKLIIEEENKEPYTWYKDEGGKDKCIELKIHLVDKDGVKIKYRKVPLKVNLIYSNGLQVADQNILALNQESRLVIDENYALIKLRINEVSTRHQGQLFQVMISPDVTHSPSLSDISPYAACTPIDVKSKRNHHNKEKDRTARGYSNDDYSNKRYKLDNKPLASAVGLYFNQSASINKSNLFQGICDSQNKSHCGINSLVEGSQNVDILPKMYASDASDTYSNSHRDQGQYIPFVHPINAQDALENMTQWARSVIAGLEDIQWHPIGYTERPDGSHDISQLLHSIPNPHTTIQSIFQQYQTYIEDSLRVLNNFLIEGEIIHGRNITENSINSMNSVITSSTHKIPLRRSLSNNFISNNSSNLSSLNHVITNVNDHLNGLNNTTSQFSTSPRAQDLNTDFSYNSQSSIGNLLLPAIKPIDNKLSNGGALPKVPLSRQSSIFTEQCQSISVPPRLSRNNSLILEETLGESEPFTGLTFLNRSISMMVTDMEKDMNVSYILAQNYRIDPSSALGLPAFDSSKKLLGFYREITDMERTTVPKFVSLEETNQSMTENDISSLIFRLEDGIMTNEDYIFHISKYSSLRDMVEQSLIYDMCYSFENTS